MSAHKSLRRRIGDATFALTGEITGYLNMILATFVLVIAGIGLVVLLNWSWFVGLTSSGIGTILVLIAGCVIFIVAGLTCFHILVFVTQGIISWGERGRVKEFTGNARHRK